MDLDLGSDAETTQRNNGPRRRASTAVRTENQRVSRVSTTSRVSGAQRPSRVSTTRAPAAPRGGAGGAAGGLVSLSHGFYFYTIALERASLFITV